MVSNSPSRIIDLGRYSIVPDEAPGYRVGSFWRRKQKEIDQDLTDTDNQNTTSRNSKKLHVQANEISFNCHNSSGRGTTNSVTPDSIETTFDIEVASVNSDEVSSDKTRSSKEQSHSYDRDVDALRVEKSGTMSSIINVDRSTQWSSVDDGHESVIVEIDPGQCYDKPSATISNSIVTSSLESTSLTVETPQRRTRKKLYPKKMSYDKILSGVKFVMSGFENPRRSKLRDKAIAMGARYQAKWDKSSTHLICAFKDTLKHKKVLAANGRIIREHWIQNCSKQRQLLDWRNYKLGKYTYPDSEEEVSVDDDDDDDRTELNSSSEQ